jgi:hypothetical protein
MNHPLVDFYPRPYRHPPEIDFNAASRGLSLNGNPKIKTRCWVVVAGWLGRGEDTAALLVPLFFGVTEC